MCSSVFQKLKSTLTSMYKYEEECDAVEKTINQHFARLHGILQNLEARLMDQVYQRPKNLKNNLTTIEQQLHEEEEQLRLAAMVRFSRMKNTIGNNLVTISSLIVYTKRAFFSFILYLKKRGKDRCSPHRI